MAKGVALKGGWKFSVYNEQGTQPGPTLPRDFPANTGVIKALYSF